MHVLQQVHLLLQEKAHLLRSSSVFVLCCLVCFLLLLVLFLNTGHHGWVAGVERAGRRGAKNSEEFRSLMRNS